MSQKRTVKRPARRPARRRPAAAPQLAGQVVEVGALTADPQNPRRRTERGRALLVQTLKEHGAARSIVLDETNRVLAGNGVIDAAPEAGISRVRIIDATGDEIIAVRRRGLTEQQKRTLAIADNRTAELAEWNPETVLAAKEFGVDLRPFWTPEEETAMASQAAAAAVTAIAEGGEVDGAEDDAATAGEDDFQTFSCALTVEQERIVRGALRTARALYEVDTTGNALTAALKDWSAAHPTTQRPGRRRPASGAAAS